MTASPGLKIACLLPAYKGHKFRWRVFSIDGVCPTLTSVWGGNNEPKILVEEANR